MIAVERVLCLDDQGRSAGVAAELIRDQDGHTSVLRTQDVYSHLDCRQSAAESIGNHVWPETTPRDGANKTP